jgi:tetratricopeptide (TPR) repeat protein
MKTHPAGVMVQGQHIGWFWPLLLGTMACGMAGEPAGVAPKPEPQSASAAAVPVDANSLPPKKVSALVEEERALAERLLKDYPDRIEPLIWMGDMHLRRGHSAEAEEYWRRALEKAPNSAEVMVSLGQAAFDKEQYPQAEEYWRKAMALRPDLPDLPSRLAEALINLGRSPEAMAILEGELKRSPKSERACYLMGRCLLQAGQYDKAAGYYEQALAVRPDHVHACYGLATAYSRTGQADKARRYMELYQKYKARSREMETGASRDGMARDARRVAQDLASLAAAGAELCRAQGKTAEAEELFRRATALEPTNTSYLQRLSWICRNTARKEEALSLLEKARDLEPKNPYSYLNLGDVLTELRRFSGAQAAFQKAIELAPREATGYRELARLYLRTGQKPAAAGLLAQTAADLGQGAEDYFVLGWARSVNGDSAGALTALRKAAELDPQNARYRQMIEQLTKRE